MIKIIIIVVGIVIVIIDMIIAAGIEVTTGKNCMLRSIQSFHPVTVSAKTKYNITIIIIIIIRCLGFEFWQHAVGDENLLTRRRVAKKKRLQSPFRNFLVRDRIPIELFQIFSISIEYAGKTCYATYTGSGSSIRRFAYGSKPRDNETRVY